MKKKNTIRIILLAFAISGILVVLGSSAPKKAEAAKESMESCTKSERTGDKMILENLSHQFFSSL